MAFSKKKKNMLTIKKIKHYTFFIYNSPPKKLHSNRKNVSHLKCLLKFSQFAHKNKKIHTIYGPAQKKRKTEKKKQKQ